MGSLEIPLLSLESEGMPPGIAQQLSVKTLICWGVSQLSAMAQGKQTLKEHSSSMYTLYTCRVADDNDNIHFNKAKYFRLCLYYEISKRPFTET